MNALKSFFTLSLLAVAGAACAQHDNEKPYLTKSFPAGGLKNVRVETSGGGISVNGQDAGEARIEMYVRSNRGRDLPGTEIKERLEKDYDITLEKSGDALVARAKRRKQGDWEDALSISFKVFTPTNVSTDLETSGGGINATGNLGDSRLVTSGGGIKLHSASGTVEAETSGGGIIADIRKLGKRLTLSTSGGSIDVKMPMDQGMDLDLQGDKVQVAMNNFDGTIEDDRVKGKLNGGGIPVRISTSGGRVRIN